MGLQACVLGLFWGQHAHVQVITQDDLLRLDVSIVAAAWVTGCCNMRCIAPFKCLIGLKAQDCTSEQQLNHDHAQHDQLQLPFSESKLVYLSYDMFVLF